MAETVNHTDKLCSRCGVALRNNLYGDRCEDCYVSNEVIISQRFTTEEWHKGYHHRGPRDAMIAEVRR